MKIVCALLLLLIFILPVTAKVQTTYFSDQMIKGYGGTNNFPPYISEADYWAPDSSTGELGVFAKAWGGAAARAEAYRHINHVALADGPATIETLIEYRGYQACFGGTSRSEFDAIQLVYPLDSTAQLDTIDSKWCVFFPSSGGDPIDLAEALWTLVDELSYYHDSQGTHYYTISRTYQKFEKGKSYGIDAGIKAAGVSVLGTAASKYVGRIVEIRVIEENAQPVTQNLKAFIRVPQTQARAGQQQPVDIFAIAYYDGEEPDNLKVIVLDNSTELSTLTKYQYLNHDPAQKIFTFKIGYYPTTAGQHTISVKVDPDNLIQEFNEGDNDATTILNVSSSAESISAVQPTLLPYGKTTDLRVTAPGAVKAQLTVWEISGLPSGPYLMTPSTGNEFGYPFTPTQVGRYAMQVTATYSDGTTKTGDKDAVYAIGEISPIDPKAIRLNTRTKLKISTFGAKSAQMHIWKPASDTTKPADYTLDLTQDTTEKTLWFTYFTPDILGRYSSQVFSQYPTSYPTPDTIYSNGSIETFNVAAPDVTIEKIEYSPTKLQGCGDPVTFTVTVKNKGDYTSEACKLQVILIEVPEFVFDVRPLEPAQAQNVPFSITLYDPEDLCRLKNWAIKARIDYTNLVNEGNENNNEITFPFTLSYSPSCCMVSTTSATPVPTKLVTQYPTNRLITPVPTNSGIS